MWVLKCADEKLNGKRDVCLLGLFSAVKNNSHIPLFRKLLLVCFKAEIRKKKKQDERNNSWINGQPSTLHLAHIRKNGRVHHHHSSSCKNTSFSNLIRMCALSRFFSLIPAKYKFCSFPVVMTVIYYQIRDPFFAFTFIYVWRHPRRRRRRHRWWFLLCFSRGAHIDDGRERIKWK